jgi:hypothetical protein
MKKILLFLMALVAFANAELQSVKYTPEEKSNDGLKAFIGVSGGNVLVADDGAIFANIRIGLDILPQISTGVWVSRLLSDVRNYNVAEKQMIKYMSFGGFVELFRSDSATLRFPCRLKSAAAPST